MEADLSSVEMVDFPPLVLLVADFPSPLVAVTAELSPLVELVPDSPPSMGVSAMDR